MFCNIANSTQSLPLNSTSASVLHCFRNSSLSANFREFRSARKNLPQFKKNSSAITLLMANKEYRILMHQIFIDFRDKENILCTKLL